MSKVGVLSPVYHSEVMNETHEKKVADLLFHKCATNFNVRLSDGTLLKRTDQPKFTLIINERKIFKKFLFKPNDLTLGKAFIDKRIDIEGDILEVVALKDHLPTFKLSFKDKIVLMARVILAL